METAVRWLETLTKCALRPTDDGAERMAQAYAAAGRGDYAAALALWEPLARAGIPRDAKLAAEWWSKAAQRDNADGQAMLGAAFHLGAGVARDRVAAFGFLPRARKGGSALAENFFDVVRNSLAPHEIPEAEARAAAPLPGASP
jgi:TPR repeat protein